MTDPSWKFLPGFFADNMTTRIKHLLKSPYMRGCLEGHFSEFKVASEATLGLPWDSVETPENIGALLRSPELQQLYEVMDFALQRCGGGDYFAFLSGYTMALRVLPVGLVPEQPFGDENPPGMKEYINCIKYTNEYLRSLEPQCSSPLAADSTVYFEPMVFEREDFSDEPIVIEHKAASSTTVEREASQAASDRAAKVSTTVQNPDTNQEALFGWRFTQFDRWGWRTVWAIAAWAVPGAALPIILIAAAGDLDIMMLIDLQTTEQAMYDARKKRILDNIYRARGIEPRLPQMCPGPIDARLPAGHPLMGMSFKYEDAPLSPFAIPLSCNCQLRELIPPSGNPFEDWLCKTDAEKRIDCMVNPYGPDDVPRPECVKLLAQDNGVDLSACGLWHCAEGSTAQSEGDTCACSLPTPAPLPPDQCTKERCADDQEPRIDPQTGKCSCGSSPVPTETETPFLCWDGTQPPCIIGPIIIEPWVDPWGCSDPTVC